MTTLRLDHAGPYDWEAMIDFLAARAIPGVELAETDRYRRTIALAGRHGIVEVRPAPGGDALAATIRFGDPAVVPAVVGRLRRLFDLDTDIGVVTARLARDPILAPLVRARPGVRLPGAWDGFELAVRAMVGQQITVAGARRLLGRIVEAHGKPLDADGPAAAGADGLTLVFPGPDRLAGADLAALGMPGARAAAISGVAAAARADPDLFRRDVSLEASIARLRALRGVGEWTAQYIAMRALREPDAFPAADVGLLRALTGGDGRRPTRATVLARAEAWRPWRAYAAQHLWVALAADGALRVARSGSVA